MSASIHFNCLLTDFLYSWELQLISKNGVFYVIQKREGEIYKLLNGGSINSAWAVIQTTLNEPFQTVVLLQPLNIQLPKRKLMVQPNTDSEVFTIVGIDSGTFTIAKIHNDDDFASATTIKQRYKSPCSMYRLFDKVTVDHEQAVVIRKC